MGQTRSSYQKLTKKPAQALGRALLHRAVKQAAKALTMMWNSDYVTNRKSDIQNDSEMDGKYRYALYYFIKYLIEEKDFDKSAVTQNRPVHIIFRRGDWNICATTNTFAPAEIYMNEIVCDALLLAKYYGKTREIRKNAKELLVKISKDVVRYYKSKYRLRKEGDDK